MKPIDPIDVDGLPEHVVRTLKNIVETYRKDGNGVQTTRSELGRKRPGLRFIEKPGKVLTGLSRRDIYDDVV